MQSPNETFQKLPVDARFSQGLHPGQRQANDLYAKVPDETKVVGLELPTGAGKSVLGLLIAQTHLEQSQTVAYLTVTDALAERVRAEAVDGLGMKAEFIQGHRKAEDKGKRESDLDAYLDADIVGVFSYAGYLAGRGVQPASVVIIDDAHAFEDEIIRRSSVTIEKSENPEVYRSILALVSREPAMRHVRDLFGVGGMVDQDDVELVPFTIAEKLSGKIYEMIATAAKTEDSPLRWELENAASLSKYLMLISRDAISFRQYVSSMWDLKVGWDNDRTLDHAERGVLMSATLGNLETLKERFGLTGAIELINSSKLSEQREAMGDRLIIPLTPTGITSRLTAKGIKKIDAIAKDAGKALVLLNSRSDADAVKGAFIKSGTDKTPIVYRKDDDLKTFRERKQGVLLTANRGLGFDLGSRYCSVAIQARVPYVMDALDGLKRSVPRDVAYTNEKVAQRLTQAFGRLNRGPHDRAVYYVLDERFPGDMREPDFMSNFPAIIQAQIQAGWKEGGNDRTYEAKKQLADKFLANKWPDYEKTIKNHRERANKILERKKSHKPHYVERMVEAWRAVHHGRYDQAAVKFASIATGLADKDADMTAWHHYLAAQAMYLADRKQGVTLDKKAAEQHLRATYDISRAPWTARLPGVIAELDARAPPPEPGSMEALDVRRRVADKMFFLRKKIKGDESEGLKTRLDRLKKVLAGGTHGEICHELNIFYEIVGYDNVVRERDRAENLDLGLYSSIQPPQHIVVQEVKSKSKEETQVIPSDIEQVVTDAKAILPEGTIYQDALPVIVTNRDKIHPEAEELARKTRTRIIQAAVLTRLVERYYELVERVWKYDDEKQLDTILHHLPTPANLRALWEYEGTVLISEAEVEAIFKQ